VRVLVRGDDRSGKRRRRGAGTHSCFLPSGVPRGLGTCGRAWRNRSALGASGNLRFRAKRRICSALADPQVDGDWAVGDGVNADAARAEFLGQGLVRLTRAALAAPAHQGLPTRRSPVS
jgi:hypothetical protein